MTQTKDGTNRQTFVTCHSVIDLSLRNQVAARALLDPQFLHKMVMSGFYGWVPDGAADPRAQLKILHTTSANLAEDLLTVVVQSRVQPDWTRIPRAALASKPEVLPITHRVEAGQNYSFRVVVHPTRDTNQLRNGRTSPNGERRRRTETDPRRVLIWFAERLQAAGEPPVSTPHGVRRIGATGNAEAFEVKMLPPASVIAGRPGQRLDRAELQGTVTVTDAAVFVDALANGIGRSRSLGCGLLLVKPVVSDEAVTRT